MGIYAIDLTPYDTGVGAETTLRYATQGFTTAPGDTPANAYYDARVKQPALLRRSLWGNGRIGGRRQVSVGELVLLNGDGDLDAILDHSWDGRGITVYYGDGYTGTFSTDFTEVFTGTIARHPDHDLTEIRFSVKDRQALVDVPLQETLYAGNNSLPAGLEGVSDLKGKPKPILYGDILNISPPEVNTAKQIYQLNDGALDSVEGVYDRGIARGRSPVAWTANTAITYSATAENLFGITHGESQFVAVGANGAIVTSADGASWSDASTPSFGTTDIDGVAYDASTDEWVACGGATKIGYSSDGDSWTQSSSNPFNTSDEVYAVATNGAGTFVVVGADSADGQVANSTDGGDTWTQRATVSNEHMRGVGFGQNKFVAVGMSGTVLTGTPNGVTWTAQPTVRDGNDDLYDVSFANGRWVACGKPSIYSSEDGKQWVRRLEFPATGEWFSVRFSDVLSKWVSVGWDGSKPVLATSSDGITWLYSSSAFSTSKKPRAIADDGDATLLVVGDSGENSQPTDAGTYASEADLLDDDLQPDPGTYKAYLAGGYIRLGSPSDGQITADAIQGAAASDRTAGQLFTDVLTQVGLTSADWNASDITALDTDNNAVLGYWSGTSPVQASRVLDELAASVGAWWGVDRTGTFRIQRFEDPSGETATVSLDSHDIIKGTFRRVSETGEGRGIPVWRSVVRYAKNYTVQESDVAANTDAARKARIAKEWLEESDSDTSVQTTHKLAREQIDDSLLTTSAAASSEATRRLGLFDASHDAYQFEIPLDTTNATIDLGTIVDLTFPRFGFSSGENVVVIGVEPDAERRRIRLTVWL